MLLILVCMGALGLILVCMGVLGKQVGLLSLTADVELSALQVHYYFKAACTSTVRPHTLVAHGLIHW
jgi:hypothetical protein